MRRPWKKIVTNLASMHQEHGVGVIKLSNAKCLSPTSLGPGESFVNLTKDEELLELEGPEVPPKVVRAWLWKQRTARATQRARGVLWSVYDQGTTTVGLGAFTKAQVT